jgi:7-carboxy-7-deazaguanine synthase
MSFARLNEVFASIQGEGLRIGERHIFVRFQGCDMSCCFCDTPASIAELDSAGGQEFCSIQVSHELSAGRDRISNPVSAFRLSELCSSLAVPGPSVPMISLTGGEPLLQHEFLAAWLPQTRGKFRILLETNGVHAAAMKVLSGLVDIVSMDVKLPSATGLRSFWEEHRQFLLATADADLFVKAVVTCDTQREDILIAARLIADINGSIPLIIQPACGGLKPDPQSLMDFQDAALGIIEDVRVIPQAHKILNVP